MNPRGTPRNFKVKNDVVVPPVSLVPQQAAGAALPIASTPSERIGQLYTPSASGLSPRLLATGLPPSAREVVELGGGPTMEGASAAPKASHWGQHGAEGHGNVGAQHGQQQ